MLPGINRPSTTIYYNVDGQYSEGPEYVTEQHVQLHHLQLQYQDPQQDPEPWVITQSSLELVIFSFGVILNLIVILLALRHILRRRAALRRCGDVSGVSFPHTVTVQLVGLAFVELFAAGYMLLSGLMHLKQTWFFGSILCTCHWYLEDLHLVVTPFLLLSVALGGFLAVCQWRRRRLHGVCFALTTVLCAIVFGALLNLPKIRNTGVIFRGGYVAADVFSVRTTRCVRQKPVLQVEDLSEPQPLLIQILSHVYQQLVAICLTLLFQLILWIAIIRSTRRYRIFTGALHPLCGVLKALSALIIFYFIYFIPVWIAVTYTRFNEVPIQLAQSLHLAKYLTCVVLPLFFFWILMKLHEFNVTSMAFDKPGLRFIDDDRKMSAISSDAAEALIPRKLRPTAAL